MVWSIKPDSVDVNLKEIEAQLPGVLGVACGEPGSEPATVRGNERFPAASLIKLPILVHFFQEVEADHVKLDERVLLRDSDKVDGAGVLLELHEGLELTLLDLATLMIVVSDNTATNLLTDRLGMASIQSCIAKLGLVGTVYGRKMYVAPDAPPANYTTPCDMFSLLNKLVQGELLSKRLTDLAVNILARQQFNEKIPLLLPKETRVAHKTGEISGVRHDSGVIITPSSKLILCLLTKELTNEVEGDRLLAELSLSLYKLWQNGILRAR